MSTLTVPIAQEKSTTGRVFSVARDKPRQALGAALPAWLSARWAAHLFATPRSFDRPDAEEQFLWSGTQFRVHGLAAWRWGSGPPVFLMHGWEGRGSQLAAFVEPLVASGFSVVAFDAPAHGASPGLEATISDFADSLLALERHVGRPAAVIAHSFGTLATLLAVKRGLSPRSLVLIAVPSPNERLAVFRQVLKLPEQVVAKLRDLVEKRVGVPFEGVEGPALAACVKVPVLVMHDRDDKEIASTWSEATARALSNAVFHATQGLGHRRILNDATVVAKAASFVAENARRSARVDPAEQPKRRRHLPILSVHAA